MKVLLTNDTMADYQGSQRYTYDAAVTLKELGHEVTVLTHGEGPTAERLREHVRVVVSDGVELAPGQMVWNMTPAEEDALRGFDAAIVHHQTTYELVRPRVARVLYESLGPHPLEMPLPGWEPPPDACVAISEEQAVQVYLATGRGVAVVPQGVRWWPVAPEANTEPKRLLLLSNSHPGVHDWKEAAEACGLEFEVVGLAALDTTGQRWHVRRHILRADVVVSIGRGAIEAACLGRHVIIDGIHGADGVLTESKLQSSGEHNYSGRWKSHHPTPGEMRDWIKLCGEICQEDWARVGRLMRAKHDLRTNMQILLDVATGAIDVGHEPYVMLDTLGTVC